MNLFSNKKPAEIARLTFELRKITFTPTNGEITVSLFKGKPDPNVSTMRQGATTTQGSQVSALVQGGIKGNSYLVQCAFNTADGQQLIEEAILPVG